MKRASYYPDNHRDSHDSYQSSGSEDYGSSRNNNPNFPKSHQKRIRHQNGFGNNAPFNQVTNSRYERFESYAPSSVERDQASKGIRVKFYKDGDPLFKGVVVSISEKMFPGPSGFQSLLSFLNEKIDTRNGVRYVFRLEGAQMLKNIKDFQNGDECVVSSTMSFDKKVLSWHVSGRPSPLKNGSSFQRNRNPNIRGRTSGTSGTSSGANNSPNQVRSKPITFNIINNTKRRIRDTMFLNPLTEQTFEELLTSMCGMVQLYDNLSTSLYGAYPPYTKVESFSNLRQELERCNTFLVCGDEGIPKEVIQQQQQQQMQQQQQQQTHYQQQENDMYRDHDRGRHPDVHNGYDQYHDHPRENGDYGRSHNKQADKPRPRQKQQNPDRRMPPSAENRHDYPQTARMNGHTDKNRQSTNRDNKARQQSLQDNKIQKPKPNTDKTPRKGSEQSRNSDRQRGDITHRDSTVKSRETKDRNTHDKYNTHRDDDRDKYNAHRDNTHDKHNTHKDNTHDKYDTHDKYNNQHDTPQGQYDEENDNEPRKADEYPNGYDYQGNRSLENDDDAYGDGEDEDEEEDDDDGPPVLRPARKGPRMETPEC